MNTLESSLQVLGRKNGKASGFSLIELIVVIAIIGILAAIALPSYSGYVIKTKRADGTFGLLAAVQALERCRSTKFSYKTCTLSGQQSISPEKHYLITLNPTPTASSFTVVATPQGTQGNDSECTSMSIDHLGNQTSTPGAAGTDTNGCWK